MLQEAPLYPANHVLTVYFPHSSGDYKYYYAYAGPMQGGMIKEIQQGNIPACNIYIILI